MRRTTHPKGLDSISFAGLFVGPPGDGHAVPWPFVRLFGKPTLDSEWSAGIRAAPVALCAIAVMDVGSVLFAGAVCGSRGPGALVACGTLVLLGRVRHVNWLTSGRQGKAGKVFDGEQ